MRTFLESLSMLGYLLLIAVALMLGVTVAGCEQKEKVLDLETPGGGVEIHESDQGAEIDVETKDNDAETEIELNGDETRLDDAPETRSAMLTATLPSTPAACEPHG